MPIALAIGLVLAVATPATANVPLRAVSQDPYTNTTSYHRTQVEADTFSFGDTIVSDFQSGRFQDGGASNIGYATSLNGGASWTNGFLPATTIYATPAGPFQRVTDPAIAYDAMHDTWIAVTLGSLAGFGFVGDAVLASRSTDGGLTFGNPITVKNAVGSQSFDKTWGSCDNTPTSPFYGHCYVEWDDNGSGNALHMSTSTNGGLTWTEASTPGSIVIGGLPLSQPNGRVVMPIDDGFASSAESFISTDGGLTYSGPFTIGTFSEHFTAGGLRDLNLVSADVDSVGKVYTIWKDCRFRSGCSSNDIVMSTSMNGTSWTAPVRIPIDDVTSTVDHFLPGITVEPGTGGATAHLALVYYFYPQTNCSTDTCRLSVGFTESFDGGATWSAGIQIGGPYRLTWLPNTTQGYMVGDYSSASFVTNGPTSVFAVGRKGSLSTCTLGNITSCNEPMASPKNPLSAAGPFRPAGQDRVVAFRSDHPVGGLKSAL